MEQVIKRKRGRPPKNSAPVSVVPVEVVKRPRGRPRKVTLEVPAVSAPAIIVETLPAKKKRGRPPKNIVQQAVISKPVKKDYIVVALEDLEFWAKTTERDMFKQAVADCNKIKKSKAQPEARWYKDKIEVFAV
jgi:hypothetical protein